MNSLYARLMIYSLFGLGDIKGSDSPTIRWIPVRLVYLIFDFRAKRW